jgi:hypothetical protein
MLSGTFFTIDATDTTAMLSYGGNFIKDFWPILAILLGLSIAGIIVGIFFRR